MSNKLAINLFSDGKVLGDNEWVPINFKTPLCRSVDGLNSFFRSDVLLVLTKTATFELAYFRHEPEHPDGDQWRSLNAEGNIDESNIIAWRTLSQVDRNVIDYGSFEDEALFEGELLSDLNTIDDVSRMSKFSLLFLKNAAMAEVNAHDWTNGDWDTWVSVFDETNQEYDLNLYADDELEYPVVSVACYRLMASADGAGLRTNTTEGFFNLYEGLLKFTLAEVPF